MRNPIPLRLCCAAALALFASPLGAQAAYVIERVNIVPMHTEGVVTGQTVVVVAGRITAVGAAGTVAAPPGATRIDGRDGYLIPGLSEMHGHLPFPNWSDALTERVMFLNVANGVTTVRGMQGHQIQLDIRDRIEAGELLGPRLFLSGPALSGNSVTTAIAAREAVRQQHDAGFVHLKIHEGLSLEAYDAIAQTAREVGITFGGHIAADVGLSHAIETGIGSVEHIDGFIEQILRDDYVPAGPAQFFGINYVDGVDRSKIGPLARRMRDAGVWVTPTQALFANIFSPETPESMAHEDRRGTPFWPAQSRAQWVRRVHDFRSGSPTHQQMAFMELRWEILRSLRDEGVGILLGADSPQIFNVPGFATVQELEELVRAGLTPLEALRAGTTNAAEYLGQDDFGTIEVGKRADLILLERNPLEDISHVRERVGVMVNGRWLSREEIDERLERYRN